MEPSVASQWIFFCASYQVPLETVWPPAMLKLAAGFLVLEHGLNRVGIEELVLVDRFDAEFLDRLAPRQGLRGGVPRPFAGPAAFAARQEVPAKELVRRLVKRLHAHDLDAAAVVGQNSCAGTCRRRPLPRR